MVHACNIVTIFCNYLENEQCILVIISFSCRGGGGGGGGPSTVIKFRTDVITSIKIKKGNYSGIVQ